MRYKAFLMIVALSAACVCAFNNSWAADDAHGDFIYASGANLMLHGKEYRYIGTNTYYLMVYSVTPGTRKEVNEIFDAAEKMGLGVIRTWAFNDGAKQWHPLQTAPGAYKESTFAALDSVIANAKERNIRLILTLVNNANDYGGAKQYVDWSPTAVKKVHNEFFTDATARQYYKDHIKAVLTRTNTVTGVMYKDDPTIMAWQLMNEPSVSDDPSGDILYNWIKEMSAHIKSIDPRHLVMVGEEGFYANVNRYDWKMNGSRGQDFFRDHSVPDVDIASFHLWPDSSKYNLAPDKVVEWINRHIEEAKKLNKPLIIDEYGEYRGYNGDTIERDRLYKFVFDIAEAGKVAGLNFWQLINKSYKKYDDGYGLYYPDDTSTIEIIKAAIATLKSP